MPLAGMYGEVDELKHNPHRVPWQNTFSQARPSPVMLSLVLSEAHGAAKHLAADRDSNIQPCHAERELWICALPGE
jgi:hypothetical protein